MRILTFSFCVNKLYNELNIGIVWCWNIIHRMLDTIYSCRLGKYKTHDTSCRCSKLTKPACMRPFTIQNKNLETYLFCIFRVKAFYFRVTLSDSLDLIAVAWVVCFLTKCLTYIWFEIRLGNSFVKSKRYIHVITN